MTDKPKLPPHKDYTTRALNAPGKYWVDGSCLICGLCTILAPKNFRFSEERVSCEVFKQPETPEEEAQVRDAMGQSCVQCIHDDGDDGFGQAPHEPPPPLDASR